MRAAARLAEGDAQDDDGHLGPDARQREQPLHGVGHAAAVLRLQDGRVCLMYLTLLLLKPTARMSSKRLASVVARMFSTVRPCARSLSIVAALTVSLVCDESISEMSVWYSMSAAELVSSASASEPVR